LLLLALTYLWAELPGHRSPERRALAVVGAIAVIPLAIMLPLLGSGFGVRIGTEIRSPVGAGLAVVLPLLLGLVLRGVESWPLILAAVWVTVGTLLDKPIGFHLWSAIGAVGLVAGGIRDQSPRRINLGIAGFALAVILFYFSSVMDRLGRSASLVVGGGLFLAGAWGLERLRRRLMAQIPPEITS
jgi:hypothetical protein